MRDLENLEVTKNKKAAEYKMQQKEKLLGLIGSKEYTPMTAADIEHLIGVPAKDSAVFKEILTEIVEEGRVFLTRKGKIITPEAADLVQGVYEANTRGFGFILADGRDVFVPRGMAGTALHGDRVLCRITEKEEKGKSAAGEIVKVLNRARHVLVGIYHKEHQHGHVIPDDKRFPKIFISDEFRIKAKSGQKVLVRLYKYPLEGLYKGKIMEILGNIGDLGLDVLSSVISHGIPHRFPNSALSQANRLPAEVNPEDLQGRQDFRNLPTVTIDGADTKDIDDAVTLERLDNGSFRLYVHIADVAHYVEEGSAIWREAVKRGTSVYLADRVIPMLPKKLSNGICSLNPNVDRLALSCIMNINKKGKMVSHVICESVIHSNHSVTYDDLDSILSDVNSEHRERYSEFVQMFEDMGALAEILKAKRIEQGALEFDFPECKMTVDADGKVTDIIRKDRSPATSIIEEFMVAANEAVATEYFWMEIPFIYRTHEEPDDAKIEALMVFLRSFGYSLRGGRRSKALQNLLKRIEDKPEAMTISKQVLRSMKQARYSPLALGHFGLAKTYYSHFTSPIRRFPDLMIHNIIKKNIAGSLDEEKISLLADSLPEICSLSSDNERRSDACQYDVEALKKIEFMSDKIGQTFSGTISHVVPRGFYVELDNTVEGMVSAESLHDDYYVFKGERSCLEGSRKGNTYSIGDRIMVEITKADVELRHLDFVVVSE